MRTLVVFGLMVVGTSEAWAQTKSAADPTGVTDDFFRALRNNDLDQAIALTAPVEKAAEAKLRPYYEKLAKYAGPSPLAHLQLSQTAVVVFVEGAAGVGPIDIDPAYLVNRDGKWLILFKLTRFDRSDFRLSEEETAQFKRLEAWYEQQVPVLQQLLRDEASP